MNYFQNEWHLNKLQRHGLIGKCMFQLLDHFANLSFLYRILPGHAVLSRIAGSDPLEFRKFPNFSMSLKILHMNDKDNFLYKLIFLVSIFFAPVSRGEISG